ncbi:ATP-binding protein [Streptosporangium sp. NPDC048047]|uniref:ATP-binding protein n=1 Tax=Streptosporangium sp. NPDC048047 TaxID=3155748 RepID=UPI003433AFB6
MSEPVTPLGKVIRRNAERLVREALTDTRVVLVNGARQSGKSTLTALIASDHENPLTRNLDRPDVLAAAQEDPNTFVEHPGLLAIDEIQYAPELLLPIKYQVGTDPRPGRFLLTGSARVLGLKSLPDALPGRMETIELWPFSQGELEGAVDGFAESVFHLADGPLPVLPGDSRRALALRIARGGFPEAVARSDPRRRRRFLGSYVNTLIERDIRDLAGISKPADLKRLLQIVAARTGRLLVAANMASELSVSARTVQRYLDLCEEIFLIKRIPAWSGNLATRAVVTPKVACVDSGIAAYLLGLDENRLATGGDLFGPLLEGFVLMELSRQLSWADEDIRLFHYRTRDQVEVDAVLETADGRVAGVEVKASATVRSEDFRGLRLLERQTGDAFAAGVVLYTGDQSLSFGPRLKALPVSALWRMRL